MRISPVPPLLQAPPPARAGAFAIFDSARFARVLRDGVSPHAVVRAEGIAARMRALRVGGAFWREGAGPDWQGLVPEPPPGCLAAPHEVFAAALICATSYTDPFSGEASTPEAYVEQLGLWRAVIDENRQVACCLGMAVWKRARIADLFRAGDRVPAFRRSAAAAVRVAQARGGAIAVWATRMPPGLEGLAAAAGVPVLRIEDGFVRSRGLGSGLLPPASVIVDGRGIYYDPSRPSDLECILRETAFDAATLARARALIELLVARDITKYAAGREAVTLPLPDGRRRILVPGQVADDLSVRLGGGEVKGNLDLLARVRAENPDAFVVYRPHPDVDAGHRLGAVPDAAALGHADLIQRGGAMSVLIEAVDEVHTLTSLAGFEALLRGKRVVTWGTPFYCGWGLTKDRATSPRFMLRRNRILPIEALVAGALLAYSRYLDPVTRLRCGPEVLIGRLTDPAIWRPSLLMRGRRFQGWARASLVRWTQRARADGRR